MWEIGVAAALVAAYLLMGVRTYRARRAASERSGRSFALREVGEALWVTLAWFLWPLVSFPRDDEPAGRRGADSPSLREP